jgi:hypothetical protein
MTKHVFSFHYHTFFRLAKHIIIMATRLNDTNGGDTTTVPEGGEQNGDDNKADGPLCPICQDPVDTYGKIIECPECKNGMHDKCALKYLLSIKTDHANSMRPVGCPFKCGHTDLTDCVIGAFPHLTTMTTTETRSYYDLRLGDNDTGYTVEMKIKWNFQPSDELFHGKYLRNVVTLRSLSSDVCNFMDGTLTGAEASIQFGTRICKNKAEEGWSSGKHGVLVQTYDHFKGSACESSEMHNVFFEIFGHAADHSIVFYGGTGDMRVVESSFDDTDVQLQKRVRREE